MDPLNEWFARIGPRLFRKTTDSPVHVIKGPLGELLDKAFTTQKSENFNLDLEPLADYASGIAEEEVYVTIGESDLHIDGHRLAFSKDWSKFVFLEGESMVFELNIERMETAVEENLRDLGFEGFFRALRRKGYSLINKTDSTKSPLVEA